MTLPRNWAVLIDEGQELRGWIVNSFAQVEYLLGDLILRCRAYPEYEAQTRSLPHGATDRIVRVRKIVDKAGPLANDRDELVAVLQHLEDQQDTRNLLVHGFASVLHTPAGELSFHFQKFHRHPDRIDARLVRTFSLDQLRSERERQAAFAEVAVDLFQRIHNRQGWEGPMSDQFFGDRPFEQ